MEFRLISRRGQQVGVKEKLMKHSHDFEGKDDDLHLYSNDFVKEVNLVQ